MAAVSEAASINDIVLSGILAVDGDSVSYAFCTVGCVLNLINLINFQLQGTNSIITYSIVNVLGHRTRDGSRISVSNTPFAISPSLGVLSVASNLEREAADNGFHYYEVTVSRQIEQMR